MRIKYHNVLYALKQVKARADLQILGFIARTDDLYDGFRYQRDGFVQFVRLAAKDRDIRAF